jgi:RimJ/RimL family protein N-acetyltransferase
MDGMVTERLILRRAREADLPAIHAVLSHPVGMRYWSTLPHRDIEQSREWLAGMIGADPAISDDYVVEHQGVVIGKAGCWRLPDIGYNLHPDYWGRGLATEAVGAVVQRIFQRHPIPRLTADIDPRNTASIRLLTKLGFAEIGRGTRTWHIGDEWCDSIYYGLPRPEL